MQQIWFRRSGLGLEVLPTELNLLEMRRVGQEWQIPAAVRRPLPPGLISMGRIRAVDALAAQIRSAYRSAPFRATRVTLAVPNDQAFCRVIQVPTLKFRQLSRLLAYEVNNNLQLPFADPVYDYAPLRPPDGQQPEALVVAAPRPLVEDLAKAVRAAGLKPAAAEVAALALLRALKALGPGTGTGVTVALAVQSEGLSLHFYEAGILRYTRHVPMNLAFYTSEAAGAPALQPVIGQIRRYTGDLAAELEQALHFYRYNLGHREPGIEQVLLVANLQDLPEIAGELARVTGLPVAPLELPGVRSAPDGVDAAANAVAAGLALRRLVNSLGS